MRTNWIAGIALISAACGFQPVASNDDGLVPVSQPPAGVEHDQCAEPARHSEVRVAVEGGELEGARRAGATAFLGIPYAAPPVGSLRFHAPTRAACWGGVRDASQFASLCAQSDGEGAMVGSEDCLYLNVFVPSAAPAAKRPVLVFLHGGDGRTGGTHQGDGTAGQLDGSALALAENAVVVTVEWRLGALGFTSHPALRAEGDGAGNYGLLDVVSALGWVQRNAKAFGGDAKQVLVFGEAAGAVNVCALLASPRAKGLFSSALMQSGACAAANVSDRDESGRQLADALGCSGAGLTACLRDAAAEDISSMLPPPAPLLATWQASFGPTVDGQVLKEPPLAALNAGRHNAVPVAVGSNADEFAVFVPGDAMPSCAEYPGYLTQVFGPLADQVEQRYFCDEALGPSVAAVSALTDAVYACPARRVARAAASGQTQPVYRYLFTHARASGPLSPLRAFHSAELPFVFQTLGAEQYVPTAPEQRLSSQMQAYWASLSRGESPSASGAPSWPRYQPALDNALVLETSVRDEAVSQGARCDFWDAVSP